MRDYGPKLRRINANAPTADSWAKFCRTSDELIRQVQKAFKIKETSTWTRKRLDPDDPKQIQRAYKINRRKTTRQLLNPVDHVAEIPDSVIHKYIANSREEFAHAPEIPNIERADEPVSVDLFSPEEVTFRLRKFENSAPGPDRITYHMWRKVDPEGKLLSQLFNLCLRFKKVPPSWKISSTIFIPKVAKPERDDEWRPIALGKTIAKIYAGLLATRLQSWTSAYEQLSPAQKGFTPHDGVFEHNFVLQTSIHKAKASKKNLYVAWLDVSNAFGSIPHSLLLNIQDKKGAGN